MRITASLVLYRNAPDMIDEAIRSVVASGDDVILSIVDNSPVPVESRWLAHARVRYHHAGTNLGFGTGHNLAFAALADHSEVHFIVNPDVSFGPDVLVHLAKVFDRAPEVVAVMPAIHNEHGEQQHLCKALPTPIHLIVRRFAPFSSIRRAIDESYEFRQLPREGLIDIPNLSGCFLGVRSETFKRVGGFDDRFFMYMEDIDLVRRLGDHGRTVYVPETCIVHGHARGSYRFNRLMVVHIESALRYFTKWGWIRDPVRKARNVAVRRAYGRTRQ
jgi:GT2 family glycosyltransferase